MYVIDVYVYAHARKQKHLYFGLVYFGPEHNFAQNVFKKEMKSVRGKEKNYLNNQKHTKKN